MFPSVPHCQKGTNLNDLCAELAVKPASLTREHVEQADARRLPVRLRMIARDAVAANEWRAARGERLRRSMDLLRTIQARSSGTAAERRGDCPWPLMWKHRADPDGFGEPRRLHHELGARAILLERVGRLLGCDPQATDFVADRDGCVEALALARIDGAAVVEAVSWDGATLGVVADARRLDELIARLSKAAKKTTLEEIGITFA